MYLAEQLWLSIPPRCVVRDRAGRRWWVLERGADSVTVEDLASREIRTYPIEPTGAVTREVYDFADALYVLITQFHATPLEDGTGTWLTSTWKR